MAFDTFIHLGALTGAALVDFNHGRMPAADGWRQIDSFSWGVSAPGKVTSCNVAMTAGEPIIKLSTGRTFPEAEVVEVKAAGVSQKPFLEYDFKPVTLESEQWSGSSGGDDTPTESVSFGFGKVAVINYNVQPTGPTLIPVTTGAVTGHQAKTHPAPWSPGGPIAG
jgi:type VI secretion system secreted protein Hcp